VGVHVRRTDYMNHLSIVNPGAEIANASYFQHAMQWMRNKLSPHLVAFVILSDDLQWCRQNFNFSDVFMPGENYLFIDKLPHNIKFNFTFFLYFSY
jgi:hypothetical protein